MNMKSAADNDDCPPVNLSRWQVVEWFRRCGGREISSKEKPLLTTQMKKDRERWVTDHGPKLTNKEVPVVFLDEKWFYKRNRRRVLKELPAEEDEDEELCRVK